MTIVKQSRILALALLLTFLLSSSILAQEPKPADTTVPPDPTITETSTYEWVTVETDKGQERILVPVTSIESVQTEQISSARARAGTRDYTFEMWRAVSWYQDWLGRYYVYTKGRTTTSVTSEIIYVYSMHKERPTTQHDWSNVADNYKSETYSTQAYVETAQVMADAGWQHTAFGHHQAKVNGVWHIRNNQWGPQTFVP